MLFLNSTRSRRVAACTALALSAGMLLAGPASADTPVPVPSAAKATPSFTQPKLTLPKKDAARTGKGAARAGADAARAGVDAAAASSLPLSDLDGDGADDFIYRAVDGELYSNTSMGTESPFELFRYEDVAKDIVPIGNQGGSTTEPEVLVLSENGTLTLYTDADPTGTPYSKVIGGGWQIYNKVTSPGDVNGDGRADVIARTQDGALYLYLGTGSATAPLGTRILVGSGWGAYDQLVGLGDGTGDGKADLYARDTAGTLWFYAGTGDKNKPFGTRVSIGGGWGAYNQILRGGDGDLLGRDNAGTLFFYPANGNGTLGGRQQVGNAGDLTGITQLAGAGNIPYTGKGSILATTPGGSLYAYFHSATGKLEGRVELLGPGEATGLTVTNLSSLNADGSADIAVQGNGDPAGGLYIGEYAIGSGWGVYNSLVGAGDLSGDGKGDLLARDRSGVLYLYKGNGQGDKFATRVKVGSGWGAYNKILGAGDYTGDGRTDIVARTSGGDLYVYPGTGNAAAPFKTRVKVGTGWNTYTKLVAPGDLNADGKADLLGVTSGGDLYRYLTTAPNKFSARTKLGGGFQVYNSMS
ncbi:VCBS repeat-containing protein [Streptomyces sp. TX20-6-3]|uniref:VCBS repeat-containing protein n=1 Tax=Streptomyces sp. TX20-6-3 TaxID=3028705 RepID=UPI0029B7B58F|nr:VCBS repeat-containing protein [Streptomyces sp. TX20-6-3]MDX2563810.1 VCBS repeat-containing protein [Streptomyces sp. TX20-6-3]